jgi:carbamoyl-phosphate synthase large subunit
VNPVSSTSTPRRVLIFPGGTEIALELREALRHCKEAVLISAGSPGPSHADFAFTRHHPLPAVHEPRWLEALRTLVRREAITHIFPAHDDALLALAEHAAELHPAKVITSPLETCRITRSKVATHEVLAQVLPCPRRFAAAADVTAFPVFLKPDRGQGSQRTALATSQAALEELLAEDPDRTVWENLPGEEYTVDCFSDRDRGLLYAAGRERLRIRAGIAMSCRWVDRPEFGDYARRIAAVLPLHGAWFFQVKRDAQGQLALLEVAPRVGGTSALSRARGVNLPLLSLLEADRVPLEVRPAGFAVEIDRALRNRYRHDLDYRTVYCDYDDTLVIHGRVNPDAIQFLYQSVDRGIKVVLLTRHQGDLNAELRRRRLDRLFDEIIHLGAAESKAEQIRETPALFIDDSFRERSDVGRIRGVQTVDPSMLEMLLDDRT